MNSIKQIRNSILLFFVLVIFSPGKAQTPDKVFYQDVKWSPGGSKLLLSRMEVMKEDYPCSIYIINTDGTGYSRLTYGPDDKWTTWSPDGEHILFVRDKNVYQVKADGGESEKLIENAGFAEYAPDGSRIAFIRQVWRDPNGWPAATGLFVTNSDDSTEKFLTQD